MIAVFTDIHGCKNEFEKLLKIIESKYCISKYIYLGDIIDRGPDVIGCIYLIKDQIGEGKDVVLLYGNHELDARNDQDHFFSIHHVLAEDYDDFRDRFQYCYKQKIGGKQFYFSHTGIDIEFYNVPEEQTLRWFERMYYALWDRERFFYGPKKENIQPNSIHVYGHTPTNFDPTDPIAEPIVIPHKEEPTCVDINIDTGCAYGGKLTCLLIDEDTGEYIFEAVDFAG